MSDNIPDWVDLVNQREQAKRIAESNELQREQNERLRQQEAQLAKQSVANKRAAQAQEAMLADQRKEREERRLKEESVNELRKELLKISEDLDVLSSLTK